MRTLLLLPGLAADHRMWAAQTEGLRDFAPRVTDVHTRAASIPEMAATLLAENPGELVLCGASMGGMVAMEAVRQASGRIRGLALLGTSARPETGDMRALREAAIALFAQDRVAEVIEPNVAFAFHPDHAADPALARTYLEFVLGAGARQLIAQNRAVMARPDARIHLPQVACPALVACGEDDALTPPECSREIAALIPGAKLELLPRCGHMLTMEQPGAVNALLRGWLPGVL